MKTIDNLWKSTLKTGMLVLLIATMSHCGKDDDSEPRPKGSEKKILSFVFLLTDNAITKNVVAVIDEENKTISATMPPETDITGLLPQIETSANASVSPMAVQNFTSPVSYTVTAEDGSEVIYTVTLSVPLSQRQILQSIINANFGNTLDWNLSATQNLGDLEGVILDAEGRIIELNLPNRNLTEFNSEIGLLSSLITLRLYNNLITSIPSELSQLKNLKALAIDGNPFTSFPMEIFTLTDLEFLSLSSINLITIPSEIGQLTKLKGLNINKNHLTSLPPEIFTLTDLELLLMDNNNLTSLPSEIGQLPKLGTLTLYKNQLTSLPTTIGQLTALTFLDISDNQLTSLPAEIGQLTKLMTLSVSNNELTALPPEMGFLTGLTDLRVQDNNLSVIPQSICNLKSYPGMDFSYDASAECKTISQKDALISIYSANSGNTLGWNVSQFPGVVFATKGDIQSIEIQNKQIRRISRSVASITSLTLLDVRNNPITYIAQEVCKMQTPIGNLTLLSDPGEGCEP